LPAAARDARLDDRLRHIRLREALRRGDRGARRLAAQRRAPIARARGAGRYPAVPRSAARALPGREHRQARAGGLTVEQLRHDLSHRFEADSVSRTLELVGEKWTLLILREAFFGVRRYGQLARTLGIPRPTLSARLRALVDAGLLERVPYAAEPEHHEYRLTQPGRPVRFDRHAHALGRCAPRRRG